VECGDKKVLKLTIDTSYTIILSCRILFSMGH
jgi:hypothetical protein